MGEANNFVDPDEQYVVNSCTCGEIYFVVTNKGVVCTECNRITSFQEMYETPFPVDETEH